MFLFATTQALAAFAAVGEPALPAGGAAAPSLIDPTDILALVAEEDQSGFVLWVTLSPLTNTLESEVKAGWTQP